MQKITGSTAILGAIMGKKANGRVTGFITGSVSVDPPSIAAATKGTIAVTVTGAAAGDIAIFEPPTALEAGLGYAGATVSATNQVTISLVNPTAGAVDGAARTWNYIVLKTS